MSMLRTIKSWFAWETVWSAGVWHYQQNRVTGDRRAIRATVGGYSPVDTDWLACGPAPEGYEIVLDFNYGLVRHVGYKVEGTRGCVPLPRPLPTKPPSVEAAK